MAKQFILAIALLLASSVQAEIKDPKLFKILERHDALFYSSEHPEGFSSYETKGQQIQKNVEFKFVTLHKSPFKIRHVFTFKHHNIVLGYNGNTGWRLTKKDGDSYIEELKGELIKKFHYEADFFGSIIRAYRGDKTITVNYVSLKTINKRKVDVIETIEADGTKIHYSLNAFTGYLERQEIFNEDGSKKFRIDYSKYRLVDGIPFAFKVEVFVDNELITTAILEEIKISSNIFDFYFEKPKY